MACLIYIINFHTTIYGGVDGMLLQEILEVTHSKTASGGFSDASFIEGNVDESRVFHVSGDLHLPHLDGCHARMA